MRDEGDGRSRWTAVDGRRVGPPGGPAPDDRAGVGAGDPTARRPHLRRRGPSVPVLLVLVTVGVGAWWAWDPQNRESALTAVENMVDSLPTTGLVGLPAAEDRDVPVPGVEEAGAPLGTPPEVAPPSSAYVAGTTQQLPGAPAIPVAWSPCRPVHYVVDTEGAPEGFADVVRTEVATLGALTGLVFVDDGLTTEPADAERSSFQPERYGDRWAPVLVRFTDPSAVSDLAAAAGITLTSPAQDPATGLAHLVAGAVYLDTELLAAPDVGSTPAYVVVLRHELGHLAGLGHVDDPSQLMNPVTSTVETYQQGDLTGLAALGAGACAPGV